MDEPPDPEDAMAWRAGEPPPDPYESADAGQWEHWEPEEWMLDEALASYAEAIEGEIRDQIDARARTYLEETGDAIWARVQRSLAEAAALQADHPGPALAAAIRASEITVRFLLLRPMLAGLVIDPALAEALAEHTFSGRTDRDHALLSRVCAAWELDLGAVQTATGSPAWPTFQRLKAVRNDYAHRAEPIATGEATDAIAVAEALLNELVGKLARRLGLPEGRWGTGANERDPLARERRPRRARRRPG